MTALQDVCSAQLAISDQTSSELISQARREMADDWQLSQRPYHHGPFLAEPSLSALLPNLRERFDTRQ